MQGRTGKVIHHVDISWNETWTGTGLPYRKSGARSALRQVLQTESNIAPNRPTALRSSSSASPAAEGGYSTLAQMNTVELSLPVIGLLLGPVLIYKDFPSMLN
jgi:hypothetical protein